MGEIFSPWQLGGVTIKNRLVRSATWEGLATAGGEPTHDLINILGDLAKNEVGLVITGYAYIRRDGLGLPRQTGVDVDAKIGPLTRISDAVHKMGGKCAMQIVHAGAETKSAWTGSPIVGPSAFHNARMKEDVRELSLEEIWDIVEAFALAAGRVKAAEFDAVELHGAHGYLINQFLSPYYNKRADEFGGSLENRARFLMEVYKAVRQVVGPRYPVFIKLNSDDALQGGLTLPGAAKAAAMLSAAGIDAIEVSGGNPNAGADSPARVVKSREEEGYFLDNAKVIKEVVDCPVIVVGGFRSREKVMEALDKVDAVAMSRPFIRQPDLALLWKRAAIDKAECISCNKCFIVSLKEGLTCGTLK